MPDLYIFSPDDKLLAILSNEAEGACPFWDARFKETLNQGSTFEFACQGDHEDSQHIIAENQVAFKDKDGDFRLFVMREIEEIDGDDGPQIHAICEPAMLELNDEIIEDKRPQNKTAEEALTVALSGTRWQVGNIAELGINSTNFYYVSVTEAIENIISIWGGEIKDRITVDETGITGRYIDLLARRGQDIGKIWEMDKDILQFKRQVQSYPKTALYGRGSSLETDDGGFTRKITFADVEWKKSKGDPVDKPKGQEWVGDPDALALFGRKNADGSLRHRFGIFEDAEEEDPEKLLQKTWEALQQQKNQVENFEMDVFLLGELIGYEHEKVRLGDTTFAINRNFTKPIKVEERVISFEYDVADPDNSGKVELGDYIDLFTDDERLDKIEARLNDGVGIWNAPVTDSDFPNIVPGTPTNVRATGLYETIMVDWDYDSTVYIANYEVYASQVQGFSPDISNLVWRGKASGYNHKASTNQQWYFRVRAVNTHGVAGDFSEEVSAQTAQVKYDDIEQAVTEGIEQAKQDAQDAVDAANQLAQTTDALQSRMTDAENNISEITLTTQSLTTQISAKADTDWVTSQFTQLSNDINLRVSKDDIINQINLSTEGILIDGAKVHITGETLIDNAVITSAMIKEIDASVVTVANINADNIATGALRGIDVYGAKFRSSDGLTNLEIIGGNVRLTQSDGGYVNVNPTGLFGYNSSGTMTFRVDKTLVTSSALGTSVENVYFGAYGEARVVNFDDIPGDGQVGSYRYLPLRADGFYGNFLDITTGVNLYIRPYSNGEVRITNTGTTTSYRPLRAAALYADSLDINSSVSAHIYIRPRSDGEVRATATGSITSYVPIRGSNLFGDSVAVNNSADGTNLYIQSAWGGEVRATAIGSTTSYVPLRAANLYAASLDTNTGGSVYVRPSSNGSVHITVTGTTNQYRPIYASEHLTGSLVEYKQDIEPMTDSALDIINAAKVYKYRLKSDVQNGIDNVKFGLIIGDGYETPSEFLSADRTAIDSYVMSSIALKAIQELITRVENLERMVSA